MVDVRRFVPRHRQGARYRHSPAEHQRGTRAPVGEIGEADEGPRADAQQLFQHPVGPCRGLQCLAQHRIVEARIGIIGKVAIGIALHHAEAARHAAFDAGSVDLDPAHVAILVAQGQHQRPVPAADIEHPATRRDLPGDGCKIGS